MLLAEQETCLWFGMRLYARALDNSESIKTILLFCLYDKDVPGRRIVEDLIW